MPIRANESSAPREEKKRRRLNRALPLGDEEKALDQSCARILDKKRKERASAPKTGGAGMKKQAKMTITEKRQKIYTCARRGEKFRKMKYDQ